MIVLAQDLRDAVLQAAIQGKLTKQLDDDSNILELIQKCEVDKLNAINNGKYKKEKFRGALQKEDYPFYIPNSWKWLYISDVSLFQEGPGILAVDFRTEGVPLIRIAGMKGDTVKLDGCNYLDPKMVKDKWNHFKLDLEDIVISTSASMDKIAEVTDEAVGAIPYTGLIRFKMYGGINKNYFKYFTKSPFYMNQINKQKSGGTIKHYGPTHLKKMIIPIPPIQEQQRIVDKIEKLMSKIDEYEKIENQLKELKKQFPDDMKDALLQAAMQGKLTKQLDSDSNVDELIKSIEEEKMEKIKLKKFKINKKVPYIDDIEKQFCIPNKWKWLRLYDIGIWKSGSTPKRSEPKYYMNGTIPWLKTGELNDGYIVDSEEKVTKLALDECSLQLNKIGDVMIAMYGATIGKLGITKIETATNQACCACTLFNGILNKYLFYFLMANRNDFIKQGAGSGQPNISKEKIIRTIIPIPPIEEQQRIIEKLDKLLPICESLSESI